MSEKDVFSTFSKEVNKRHEEMIKEISSINIDNLKTQGVKLVIGGKSFEFTDLKISDDSDLEEKIRIEFREKINTQQKIIREKINSKINQLLLLHQTKQQEFERKEKKLQQQYSEASLMPDIKFNDFFKYGLSVYKGNSNNELTWAYNTIYAPRIIITYEEDNYNGRKVRKLIPNRLVNRMKKNIIITIQTKGNEVLSVDVKTLKSGSISSFSHYHRTTSGDCWGNWNYPRQWKDVNDILNIAKEASAILETINHGSIASREPSGLPKLETVVRAVEDIDEINDISSNSKNKNDNIDNDVWSSI